MAARKMGPAFAAGCTVIVKAAKQTPISMHAVAAILQEAGLPDGVLGTITTSRASAVVSELIRDPRLRKLSFTGSTEVGQSLATQAAATVLRVSLELGGNAPFIVFDDADVDHAVEQARRRTVSVFTRAVSMSSRRSWSSDSAGWWPAGERAARSPSASSSIKRPSTRWPELVTAARADGAGLAFATPVPDGAGCFAPASVLVDVPTDSRIVREEIFSPVAPIVSFRSEEEVLEWSNASEYGLAGQLFTRELDRAIRVAEALEAGMIGINRGVLSNPAAPSGGFKASGYVREGGHEGIDEYVKTKYLSLSVDGAAV